MFDHVCQPTDFSNTSQVAFAHALRLALASQGQLAVLHVQPEGAEGEPESFPPVRRTLAAWGLVPATCQPEDVARLGVRIKKLEIEADDPGSGIGRYLGDHPSDLLVLATHQHAGLSRWARPPVAEPVMRSTRVPSLFIPPDCEGFVRLEDGAVRLARILVPVAEDPDPQLAVDMAAGVARLLGVETLEVTVLHVGEQGRAPEVHVRKEPAGWTWNRVSIEGPVVGAIGEAAAAGSTDLVVMTTRGPQGFLGALRGSTASSIIRRSTCPVLVAPSE